jgi:hypothetical protein
MTPKGPHPQMSSSPIDALLRHRPTDSAPPIAVTDGEQQGLLAALSAVPDPRDPRGVRYPLTSLLAVAVCAVLAGAVIFAAMADWAADLDPPAWAMLGFTGRVPAATTVWRLLVPVDADVLSAVLTGWLRSRTTTTTTTTVEHTVAAAGRRPRMVIAVDGKVQRGSRLPDGRQVHLLSAYDTITGLVLAQVQIEAKSNEIPAFTPPLDRVQAQLGSLAGAVIVADALHAQTAHARDVATGARTCTSRSRPTSRPCTPSSRPCPGRRYRLATVAATPGTVGAKPAPSKRSPSAPPAGRASRTPSRPYGSPAPAPSKPGPPARRRTWSCRCPPNTLNPAIYRTGHAASGTSKTGCTGSAT